MKIEISDMKASKLRTNVYNFSITANYLKDDDTLIESKSFSIGGRIDEENIKDTMSNLLKDKVNKYKLVIEEKQTIESDFSTLPTDVDSLINN
jgi:hypothetical protein